MWSYWRDKYRYVEALEDYFPDTLREEPILQQALYQIKAAEALIDSRMQELMLVEERDSDPSS